MYYLALFFLFFLIGFAILLWQLIGYYRRYRLRQKVLKMPLPSEWQAVLQKVPHYKALPEDLKEKMRPKMLYFALTKEFMGVKLEVTEEMKAIISFYACLMVVNIPNECYDELVTILIYPYDVVTKEVRANGGIYEEGRFVLEGQTTGDTVVIAWSEAKREAFHLRSHNVVIHELAHVLDFEDGMPDGVPPLERSRLNRWTQVLYRRYEELRQKSDKNRNWGDYRLIGEYAATDEAEFFAVVTELFFQKPRTLKIHFPDLYEEWREFYRLDTAELFGDLEKV